MVNGGATMAETGDFAMPGQRQNRWNLMIKRDVWFAPCGNFAGATYIAA